MLVVGYEGIAGVAFWIILLTIFQYVPCTAESICHYSGVIENTTGAFREYAANPILILQSMIIMLGITVLNISGMSITKYGSSA